jgi:hypothetical protein
MHAWQALYHRANIQPETTDKFKVLTIKITKANVNQKMPNEKLNLLQEVKGAFHLLL